MVCFSCKVFFLFCLPHLPLKNTQVTEAWNKIAQSFKCNPIEGELWLLYHLGKHNRNENIIHPESIVEFEGVVVSKLITRQNWEWKRDWLDIWYLL